jgi:hypothetical protein
VSLYSLRISYTKHLNHDRLRAIPAAPPRACPGAHPELRKRAEPSRRQSIDNLPHTRTDAFLPADIADTSLARVRSWWRAKPTTPPADELCATRIYAWHAPAVWHVALAGSRDGDGSCSGTSRLSGTVCDSRPACTRSPSFTTHVWSADEGRRPWCSAITDRCVRPHGRKHAVPSSNDSPGNAAATHEHSNQQPCHAAAATCDESRGPKAVSTSSDGATTPTAPAVA